MEIRGFTGFTGPPAAVFQGDAVGRAALGRAPGRDEGHEFIPSGGQAEGLFHLFRLIDDLAQPHRAKPQRVGGQQQILDAGPRALMVLHGVVARLPVEKHGHQHPGVAHDAGVLGAARQRLLPGVAGPYHQKAPRLVVQAAGCPAGRVQQGHDLVAGDRFAGKAADAAPLVQGVEHGAGCIGNMRVRHVRHG